jgi:type I restriction enzyme, S subunit
MSEWKETDIGQIPSYWDLKTVDEIKSEQKKSIISGPFGSNISAKYFVERGVPVIRGNNLSLDINKKFNDNGFVFITEEKAKELGTWAEKNDIVFTAVGTIGQVGILKGDETFKRYIISNKQLRLRVNESIVEPLYAYYWFASPFMIDVILQRNTGSSVPLINLSVLKSLLIPIPPKEERVKVLAILSSLDDKIDLLHRQNQTLEKMAETLFRQWFVEEAKEEWEEYKIADISEHLKSNVIPAKQPNTVFHHYSLPAYDEGQNPLAELGISILSNKYKVVPNSILVSKLNPRFPRIWAIDSEIKENSICSTEFQVFKPKDKRLFAYLFFLFKSEDAKNALEMAASGTSGSHQRVRPEDILNIPFTLPNIDLAIKFSEQTQSFLDKVNKNKTQIRTLTTLRDTLLPKLMSGEVRVEV